MSVSLSTPPPVPAAPSVCLLYCQLCPESPPVSRSCHPDLPVETVNTVIERCTVAIPLRSIVQDSTLLVILFIFSRFFLESRAEGLQMYGKVHLQYESSARAHAHVVYHAVFAGACVFRLGAEIRAFPISRKTRPRPILLPL